MKIIKIENSYDLGDSFSGISMESAWKKLINYIQNKKDALNKISIFKEHGKIFIQSLYDDNDLLSIIKKVDPSKFFKKNLIRTIKLNLKFNKESK